MSSFALNSGLVSAYSSTLKNNFQLSTFSDAAVRGAPALSGVAVIPTKLMLPSKIKGQQLELIAINPAKDKHQTDAVFMKNLHTKWQKLQSKEQKTITMPEQVKPQDSNHKQPIKANWLHQAWLGFSENAARTFVDANQFFGADTKWVEQTNTKIAHNLYYKGADINSSAFGVGKAINNIGTGAIIAEGAIASAPESALISLGGFLMRPAIRAGAPVVAALQTATGIKNRDAEQISYGVTGLPISGAFLFKNIRSMGELITLMAGRNAAAKNLNILSQIKSSEGKDLLKLFKMVEDMPAAEQVAMDKTLKNALVERFKRADAQNLNKAQKTLDKLNGIKTGAKTQTFLQLPRVDVITLNGNYYTITHNGGKGYGLVKISVNGRVSITLPQSLVGKDSSVIAHFAEMRIKMHIDQQSKTAKLGQPRKAGKIGPISQQTKDLIAVKQAGIARNASPQGKEEAQKIKQGVHMMGKDPDNHSHAHDDFKAMQGNTKLRSIVTSNLNDLVSRIKKGQTINDKIKIAENIVTHDIKSTEELNAFLSAIKVGKDTSAIAADFMFSSQVRKKRDILPKPVKSIKPPPVRVDEIQTKLNELSVIVEQGMKSHTLAVRPLVANAEKFLRNLHTEADVNAFITALEKSDPTKELIANNALFRADVERCRYAIRSGKAHK